MSAQPQEDLENLLAGAKARSEARSSAIAKVSYNHAAMIDLIIAHPGISQNALAQHFGLTPSWVSQVIVSDAFQSALAKRREEVIDPILQASVKESFDGLVARSLDILQQKLNRPALEIPDNLALRALEISSRAAGYGVKDVTPVAPATPAEVHIHLEQLGGGLVALLQRKKLEAGVIDVTPQPSRGANPQPGTSLADDSNITVALQIAQLTNDVSEEH